MVLLYVPLLLVVPAADAAAVTGALSQLVHNKLGKFLIGPGASQMQRADG